VTSARPVAALMLLLTLTCVYFGLSLLVQDLAYTRAQTELSFWGRGNYQPTVQAIQAVSETLEDLLEGAPQHPEYLQLQANNFSWQAYWSQDMSTRDALNGEAVTNQYRALQSRPAHRQGWSKMVEYASRASSGRETLPLAQKRLALLQPPGNPERPVQ
jgi:hypothetical protein